MRSILRPEGKLSARRISDAELLLRLRAGHRSALVELVRRWEDVAYRIACRITGDVAAAEDVRQAVFLRLLERPGAIRRADCLGAWIKRAVVNEAISTLRRRKRLRPFDLARFDGGDGRTAPGEGPEAIFAESEEARRLRGALACLSPADRALLALRFDESLTYEEIARVLRRPVSTIKSQVKKALERLKSRFGNSSLDRERNSDNTATTGNNHDKNG